jgi:hypothetical protein
MCYSELYWQENSIQKKQKVNLEHENMFYKFQNLLLKKLS